MSQTIFQMTGKLKYYLHATANIEDSQLDEILKCFKPISVKRNTILLSEGEISKSFYFVHSGCIRTYYMTKQGQEKTRFVAFEGSFATAMSSFIAQQPSFEFVDALENSELLSINHTDFYRFVNQIPQWEAFYRKLLEMAYIYQNKKIESLVTLSAKQRYDNLLSENPYYIQRLSNKILATYLDITQETLSRLKAK